MKQRGASAAGGFTVAAIIAAVLISAGVASASRRNPQRSATEQRLAQLVRSSAAAKLAADPIGRARDALARADKAKRDGDAVRAALLEGLAAEWVDAAADLVRAAALEARADRLERAATATATKIRRAEALFEETLARKGRALERLEKLEQLRRGAAAEGKGGSRKP